MDFETFVSGPLLWAVFTILLLGMFLRIFFFLFSILKKKKHAPETSGWKFFLKTLSRFLFPLHRVLKDKPIYTLLRYMFHICLILVPLTYDGHITMLEASSLELSWPAVPDKLADVLTVLYIILGVFFLIRRLFLPHIRRKSSVFDYVFIIFCLLPFLSGYFLAHGSLDSISFFSVHLFSIHILTSCIMILTAALLFLNSRLDMNKCTGCAACESNCPTGTLGYSDNGIERIFHYSHYLCVSCGACISSCPENAAELRHKIGLRNFFWVLKKQEIRRVELEICRACGGRFAPAPQIENIAKTIEEEYIHLCPKCKKFHYADTFRHMLPRTGEK